MCCIDLLRTPVVAEGGCTVDVPLIGIVLLICAGPGTCSLMRREADFASTGHETVVFKALIIPIAMHIYLMLLAA
jgi:hypothetical protein